MFTFVLLFTFLVLSRIRTVGDAFDWDFPRSPASTIITENIYGNVPYAEFKVYEDFVLSPRRRLLEYPRWIKQAYRSNDYNVVRKRHQFRNKLDENRSYRSAVNDDENNNEEEEEEEEEENEEEEDEGNEENKLDDEEIEEQDENEEETVAAVRSGSRSRGVRSGYVPFGGKVNGRERQEVVRIRRSTTEKCENGSTESPQYYEYEIEVRNNQCRRVFLAKMLGVNFLLFLLT
ncbi:uncharacterized protein [Anoplolepis gracilipes]|uniref:uncharacterized protein n=1 Tax=Anoplolepis gracilipes TaxID=354296 RepID=UPI003BA2052F